MNIKLETCGIAGCYLIDVPKFEDGRGSFTKIFHHRVFSELGVGMEAAECFYSRSRKGVLRGMHFQTPPHDHAKLVHCIEGRICDVVVDLRKGSPSEKQTQGFQLSGDRPQMVFIPRGCAHGFLSLSDDALMIYMTSTAHNPKFDCGVRWDSIGFDWGVSQPVLSERDSAFTPMGEWESPFLYEPMLSVGKPR